MLLLLFYYYRFLIQNNKDATYLSPHLTWPLKGAFLTLTYIYLKWVLNLQYLKQKQTTKQNNNQNKTILSFINHILPWERLCKSILCPLWIWKNIESEIPNY